jgi:hypothetical protein
VKSSTSTKEEHLPDLAVQVHAAREQGFDVVGAELMHLNRECRHPDLSNLFTRQDLLPKVAEMLPEVPSLVREQLEALEGPLPEVATGSHCRTPYDCPFLLRCWPNLPEHHISTLNGVGPKKSLVWESMGVNTIFDIPEDAKLNLVQARQRRAIIENRLIVEPELREALRAFDGDAAFLDFETIKPAIPVWPGCRPFDQVPVQVSIHRIRPGSPPVHFAYLAEGPGDPREAVADTVVEACRGADVVIAWNASFEKAVLNAMAEAMPLRAAALHDVVARLRDPMPAVKQHLCHPGFEGGFGLKDVLPVLVPGLGYEDLTIRDGDTAANELERLLLRDDLIQPRERVRLRRDLLAYCERDTWAMVVVLSRLRELATATIRGTE